MWSPAGALCSALFILIMSFNISVSDYIALFLLFFWGGGGGGAFFPFFFGGGKKKKKKMWN